MTDRPASAQDFKPDEDSTLDNYVNFSKGSGLFDAFANVVKNISEGDGGEIVAHGLGLGLGIAGVVADPIQTVLAAGAGWLMEHVKPLKDFLDLIAGDPDAVAEFHAYWKNIAEEVNLLAKDLKEFKDNDLKDMSSTALDAYRSLIDTRAEAVAACGKVCEGVASAAQTASATIDMVRGFIRDLIAQAIAVILEAIILAATIFLIPLAIAKTVSTVVTTASKVTNLLNKLLAYAQKMAKELGTLKKMAMDYLRGIWEPAAANAATGVAGMKTDNL